MADKAEVLREVIRRKHALTGMGPWREFMEPCGLPDVAHAPALHHRAMTGLFEGLAKGAGGRVLMSLPPGAAKSVLGSIQFPLWYAASHPHSQILCLSHTQTLAHEFSRRRRALALTPEMRALGAGADVNAASLDLLQLENGSTIRCMGAGAAVSGFRADLVIGDDLVSSLEVAMSREQLDKLWGWYETEALTRLKPTGRIALIGTRWATLDPLGRALALNEQGLEPWQTLILPMEARAEDPLGRKPGDRLWPEHFTARNVEDAKRDEFKWRVLFQCEPRDAEGLFVSPDLIKTEPAGPSYGVTVLAVDAAYETGGKNDRSAICVGRWTPDRKLHVMYSEAFRNTPDETVRRLAYLAKAFGANECLIEDDQLSRLFVRMAREQMHTEKLGYLSFRELSIKSQSKEVRAGALRALLHSDRVRFVSGEWNRAVFDELNQFPGGRHDDIVDSLGLLARAAGRYSIAEEVAPTERVAKPLIITRHGVPYLNESLEDLFRANETSRRARARL